MYSPIILRQEGTAGAFFIWAKESIQSLEKLWSIFNSLIVPVYF